MASTRSISPLAFFTLPKSSNRFAPNAHSPAMMNGAHMATSAASSGRSNRSPPPTARWPSRNPPTSKPSTIPVRMAMAAPRPALSTGSPNQSRNRARGSMSEELPDVDDMAGDGGGRGHGRAHQVGASAPALTALEVAVGGRGAAFARRQAVGVHAQAHGAARLPPVEARGLEDGVEAFFLGLGLHKAGARNHHGPHVGGHQAAVEEGVLHDARGGAQVLDTAVG